MGHSYRDLIVWQKAIVMVDGRLPRHTRLSQTRDLRFDESGEAISSIGRQ